LTPRKGDPEYLETIEEAINIKTSKSCPVKIISVEMLIKMKEIAAADYFPEREKHLTDIECLKQIPISTE